MAFCVVCESDGGEDARELEWANSHSSVALWGLSGGECFAAGAGLLGVTSKFTGTKGEFCCLIPLAYLVLRMHAERQPADTGDSRLLLDLVLPYAILPLQVCIPSIFI